MNVIDIIVGALLIYALWRGWSSGILVQLSGILGIILGTWIAFRFSERACGWFSIETSYKWLVFVALMIVIMITVIILCKLLTKALAAGGLSLPLKFLGAVASVVKVIIILSLILRTFESVNEKANFDEKGYVKQSVSYEPLNKVADMLFPYLSGMLTKVEFDTEELDKMINEKVEKEIDKQIQTKLEQLQNTTQNE